MEILTSLARELSQVDTESSKSKENAVGTLKAAVIVVNIDCHAVSGGVHRSLQTLMLFLANIAINVVKSNELIRLHTSLSFSSSVCICIYIISI